MDLQCIFGAPRDVLEVSEGKPLLSTRARSSRRGLESSVPVSVRTVPLVSWTGIIGRLVGRTKGKGKLIPIIITLLGVITQVSGTICPCITQTRQGRKETQTLEYKSAYQCLGNIKECSFNNINYKVCYEKDKPPICYDPTKEPERIWIEMRAGKSGYGSIIDRQMRKSNGPVSLTFDACKLLSYDYWGNCGNLGWERTYQKNDKYIGYGVPQQRVRAWSCNKEQYYLSHWSCVVWATWPGKFDPSAVLKRGKGSNSCKRGECNPVNFTILKPKEWDTKDLWSKVFGLRINGKGKDPGGYFVLKQVREGIVGEDMRTYKTFWKELESDPWEQSVTTKTINLFVELAQTVATTMNVSNCYICGGTLTGDQWPWEVIGWNQTAPYNTSTYPTHKVSSRWELASELIGESCVQRTEQDIEYPSFLGDSTCKFIKVFNGSKVSTWGNSTLGFDLRNPWENLTEVARIIWHNGTLVDGGVAPAGLYWVCGTMAYSHLRTDWTGTCYLGHLRPSFFMIPLSRGMRLGQPAQNQRKKRELKIGSWKDDEWPPERILAYYDPASWAQDGSYGYRTPIYLLNRLIRLQAVVELLTRENELALEVLAKQNTKIKNAIYQNRLALDYLLATDGGVCGKFNLTNCCLEIGDTQEVIAEITGRMRELANVPVQTWTGMLDSTGWLGGIFNNWKQALFFLCMILLGMMLLPCLIPLVRNMINSAVQAAMPKTVPMMVIRAPEVQYKILPIQEGESGE
uniref:Endogenous retrovirus group 3 member 1 Env polyprotein-like n=1 Tax=Pogona vitticeps TaxID=103695 RepID=A0ABM5GMN4_9SAUR